MTPTHSCSDSRTSISSRSPLSSASSPSTVSNGVCNEDCDVITYGSHISDPNDAKCSNENENTISTKYPVLLRIDSMLITYAALTVLIIEKNISAVAFNSLLSVLQVSLINRDLNDQRHVRSYIVQCTCMYVLYSTS